MATPAPAQTPATGPRTPAGKAVSSRNALKHGLASGTLLLPDEDPAAFDELITGLRATHRPKNTTEELLVDDMARHHWLMDRAIRLQTEALASGLMDRFALFLRYQTANHRAFYKALATLQSLRKATASQPSGFVSQSAKSRRNEMEVDLLALLAAPLTEEREARFAKKYGLRKPSSRPTTPAPRSAMMSA